MLLNIEYFGNWDGAFFDFIIDPSSCLSEMMDVEFSSGIVLLVEVLAEVFTLTKVKDEVDDSPNMDILHEMHQLVILFSPLYPSYVIFSF